MSESPENSNCLTFDCKICEPESLCSSNGIKVNSFRNEYKHKAADRRLLKSASLRESGLSQKINHLSINGNGPIDSSPNEEADLASDSDWSEIDSFIQSSLDEDEIGTTATFDESTAADHLLDNSNDERQAGFSGHLNGYTKQGYEFSPFDNMHKRNGIIHSSQHEKMKKASEKCTHVDHSCKLHAFGIDFCPVCGKRFYVMDNFTSNHCYEDGELANMKYAPAELRSKPLEILCNFLRHKDNQKLFVKKKVLVIGDFSYGIISMLLASQGAKIVITIDPSNVAKLTRYAIEENGLSKKCYVIQDKVDNIDTLEPYGVDKVDMLISVWMGLFLFEHSLVTEVIKARDKWLKPGGVMVPESVQYFIMAVGDYGQNDNFENSFIVRQKKDRAKRTQIYASLYDTTNNSFLNDSDNSSYLSAAEYNEEYELNNVSFTVNRGMLGRKVTWWENVYNFDMSCMKKRVMREPYLMYTLKQNDLLSTPWMLKNFDMQSIRIDDLKFEACFRIVATRNDVVHGLTTFFDLYFRGNLLLSSFPIKPTFNDSNIFFCDEMAAKENDIFCGDFRLLPTANMKEIGVDIEIAKQFPTESTRFCNSYRFSYN